MGIEFVVMASVGGSTVMLSALVAVAFAESFTCTVKFDAPAAVGVPEMTPAVVSERFAGRDPAEIVHVFPPEPPLAERVCE